MQTFIDILTLQLSGPTFFAIGNFDGIHRGHQVLLRRLQEAAQAAHPDAKTALLTFDPHPLTVLRPDQRLKLLTTPQERIALADELGIHLGIIQPFTLEIAGLSAREFMGLLKEHVGLAGLVVGPDFALGRDRGGTLDVLQMLGTELGYDLVTVEPVNWQGSVVRSSHIRQLLSEGRVAEAAELLGRDYHATGAVEQGDRRGRQLGAPTANLRTPADKLLPADGVYATRTWLHSEISPRAYPSVTNLGVRPTVDGLHHRLETHLLDFPAPGQTDDLYGQIVTVEFIERLRGEKRFSNIQELAAQIHADIGEARRICKLRAAS